MRALLLGGRGAVGRVVAHELRTHGAEVTSTSRSAADGTVRLDLESDGDDKGLSALARLAEDADVVVNVSGIERAELAAAVGRTPLVDIAASAGYLDALAAAAPPGASIVLGAGLVPGLSTILVEELDPEPGDDVDVLVMLGSGERHGAASLEWTLALAGAVVEAAPEDVPVINLRTMLRHRGPDGRRRRYLRADFPDHALLGRARQCQVRSWLTLSHPLATAAMAVVGRAPALRWTLRSSPPLGSEDWHVEALDRRSGQRVAVTGTGQSQATGVLTARAALAVAEHPPGRVVTMADVVTVPEAAAALDADRRRR